MTDWKQEKSGLILPVEKPKPKKQEQLKTWNCPHCDYFYDVVAEGPAWEATVGGIRIGPNPQIPHINCPACDECMGCCTK